MVDCGSGGYWRNCLCHARIIFREGGKRKMNGAYGVFITIQIYGIAFLIMVYFLVRGRRRTRDAKRN